MSQVELQHILWLLLAIGLEIIANIWLKFSDGFRRPVYGAVSGSPRRWRQAGLCSASGLTAKAGPGLGCCWWVW